MTKWHRLSTWPQGLTRLRFGQPVATLVVLADTRPGWRPGPYEEQLWGCRVRFEYPVCKLLDFGRTELEGNANPAATVIAAHLAAQATGRDMTARKALQWQLTRRLYERGYRREEIMPLFRPDRLAVGVAAGIGD